MMQLYFITYKYELYIPISLILVIFERNSDIIYSIIYCHNSLFVLQCTILLTLKGTVHDYLKFYMMYTCNLFLFIYIFIEKYQCFYMFTSHSISCESYMNTYKLHNCTFRQAYFIISMQRLILRKDTIFWLKVASVNHCINNLNAKRNYTKCTYKIIHDICIFFNI